MGSSDVISKISSVAKLIGLAAVAGLLFGGFLMPTFGGAGLMAKSTADGATPLKLDEPPLPQRSTILASDGTTKIAQFYTENRVDVSLDQVSPTMQKALIDIEDSRFYQHGPLDLKGTLRALVRNQASGNTGQGGSSITQQYVKNVLFETAGLRVADYTDQLRIATNRYNSTKDHTLKAQYQGQMVTAKANLDAATKDQLSTVAPKFSRKIQEMRYALWVEQHYSKKQILEKYLNTVFFGNQTNGIEAAALRYFSVHASQLTLTQSAMLAGMVNNAIQNDPLHHPQTTLSRRNIVIDRMAQLGDISKAEAEQAKAAGLGLQPKAPPGGCVNIKPGYGYFCDYVRDEILNNPAFGATDVARQQFLNTGGLTIKTTLDPKAQDAAQSAVSNNDSASSSKVTMEAMVEPGTGRIVAIALSQPYGLNTKQHENFIDYAADQFHGGGMGVQAGSTFKLFTLATALANGYKLDQSYPTPAQLDQVTGYKDCSGAPEVWETVHNAESSTGGSEDLATATWQSTNTYFAQLERDVGLCKVAKTAASFGMTLTNGKPLQQVPSFTLGANDIDIVHEAAAYAGFAASGKYCSPIAIDSMTDRNGKQLTVPSANCHQAIDADVANEVTDVLKGVLTRGTARGSFGGLGGRDAAGKTGTTEDLATALFAGYTRNMAAVVWRGDPTAPNGDKTGNYGADLVPVWEASLNGALAGVPDPGFPSPSGDYGVGGNSTPGSPSPNPGNPGKPGKPGKPGHKPGGPPSKPPGH